MHDYEELDQDDEVTRYRELVGRQTRDLWLLRKDLYLKNYTVVNNKRPCSMKISVG